MDLSKLTTNKLGTIIMAAIVVVMVIVTCVNLAIYLRKKMLQALARRDFCDDFGFEKLDMIYKVDWNKAVGQNCFFLGFPQWTVANKDGTGNKRIRNNTIIWNNSVLYVDKYVVRTRRPDDMLDLVYDLRYKNVFIPKCQEEERKYNQLVAERNFYNTRLDIDGIIRYYEANPTEFEQLCARAFRQFGFYATVTKATNDGGYDIKIEKDGFVSLVECKCYAQSHKIGRPAIQKLVGANAVECASGLIFITTSDFTPNAKEYAKGCGVQLFNGEALMGLLRDSGMFNQQEAVIYPEELCLTGADLRQYMPKDIYYAYF